MSTDEQPVEEVKLTPEELEAEQISKELTASLAIAMKVHGEKIIGALLRQAHQEQKVFFLKQEGLLFAANVLPQQAIDEYPEEEVRNELNKPYPTGSVARILLHRGEDILIGNFTIPAPVTSEVASS